jgi:hypothetical protein
MCDLGVHVGIEVKFCQSWDDFFGHPSLSACRNIEDVIPMLLCVVVARSATELDYLLVHRRLTMLPHRALTNCEGIAKPHLGVLFEITVPSAPMMVDVLKRGTKFDNTSLTFGPLGCGAGHDHAASTLAVDARVLVELMGALSLPAQEVKTACIPP